MLPRVETDASGIALAWLSLPQPMRSALAQEFVTRAQRLRLKQNPLWVDLEDEEPSEHALGTAETRFLPSLTAASALSPGQWRTPDGALQVEAVPCPPLPVRCESHVAREDVSGRRTRFAAWALTRALLVQSSSAAVAARVARTLQERLLMADALVGLVLQGGEHPIERTDTHAQDTVRQLAAQLLQRDLGSELLSVEFLRTLSQLPSHPRLPAWLPLSATQVLVVPRLSSQFAGDALREELTQCLATAGVLSLVRIGPALD